MRKASLRKLICPKCHKYFGDLDIRKWPSISARDIKILVGDRRRFKDGDSLKCTLCNYEYTTYDIVIAGASPDTKEDLAPGQESVLP